MNKLIDSGADINQENKGWTPICEAIWNKQVEAIKLLVGNKASTKIRSEMGDPIDLAYTVGEEEIIQIFEKKKNCKGS